MHRGFLVVGAGLAFAVPAHADTTTAVSFADACGDNHPFVEINGTRQELPSSDSSARFDIKRVTVDHVADGVSVLTESCAPVGSPDGLKGERLFSARLPDGCYLGIAAIDDLAPGQSRSAHVEKDCYGQSAGVAVPGVGPVPDTQQGTDDKRFDITLPAGDLTVVDGALLVTVHRSDVASTPEAAAALAPGTAWQQLQMASAEDLETTIGFGGSSDQNNFRWSAPTGIDFAGTTQPFTP
jgi:hypothetical protein